MHTKIDMTAK